MSAFDALALLERARQELHSSKPDRADLLLELLQDQLQAAAPASLAPISAPRQFNWLPVTQAGHLREPKSQSVQPVLDLRKQPEPNPLYEAVCEYLRTRVIGYAFTHKNFKEHFLASANIELDKTIDSTGYERYRYHLSKAFETLHKHGVLQKGSKKTEHVLVKYP
jgi:hypothetical protein